MIYKFSTREINGKVYISGSRLLSEKGIPIEEYEFTKPLARELVDSDYRLQWTIRDNPDYDPETDHIDDRYIIENDPIPPTSEELQVKQEAKDKADYIAAMPELVKGMVIEIEELKGKVVELETAKEAVK